MADQEEVNQPQEQSEEVVQEAQEEATEQENENQSNEIPPEGGDNATDQENENQSNEVPPEGRDNTDAGQEVPAEEQSQDVNENAGVSEEVQGEAQEVEQQDAQGHEQQEAQEAEQAETQEAEQTEATKEDETEEEPADEEQGATDQSLQQEASGEQAEEEPTQDDSNIVSGGDEVTAEQSGQESEQHESEEIQQDAAVVETQEDIAVPEPQADEAQEGEQVQEPGEDKTEIAQAEEPSSQQAEVEQSDAQAEQAEATGEQAGETDKQAEEANEQAEAQEEKAPAPEEQSGTTETVEAPAAEQDTSASQVEQVEAAGEQEQLPPGEEQSGEKAAEVTEQAAEANKQAGEATEQAAEQTGEATEQVAEQPAETTDQAVETTEQAAEQPVEATEQAAEQPAEATEQAGEASEQAAKVIQDRQEKPTEGATEAPTEQPPVEKPPSPAMVEGEAQEPVTDSQKEALTPRNPGVNLEATATVKFVLMPSGQVVTLANMLGQTLGELKWHFASALKMPVNLIMLMFDGKGMNEDTTLADLGVGPNGTVQLEMQSADPVNNPLKPYRPRQEYHMPDVITVRVMTEDCEAKDVVVEIERSRTKKPFLGGFRNKNTGVEYHNASAQTMQKPRPPPTTERFCRDTQTCEQKNTLQQTTNTTSTQMTGINVYVSNAEDTLITPGKFFTADEHRAMILRNVIILQKYYRRWLAKRYVTKLKEDKAERLEWERQEEIRKKKEKEDRIKMDYARRINPKTMADFDMLIHCLEKWRQEEMERINATLTGAERKAAMCMLLDQETELLSAIERHKNEANIDNKEKNIMSFLDKAAAPKKWQGHDGNLTYMDTPYTIRAKELRDIYNSINMKYLTQDERLDVLLTLKHTVKEHDCKLTQEIIELIDREADLLMRGVKEGNLTGLRKRISTLFLQYIKTPTFNPEAAKLLKVPQDPSTLRKDINYCHSCGSYKPSTEFFITSNSKNVGRCRKCQKVENDGSQRQDHTYYKAMIKTLRKSEEAMQDGSTIAYLLQEHDLRYLVESIWSNQSVLSAWNDLYDLVLVRWDKHQEWSPWNCVLLTHDEAAAHKKLFNLEEGYGHVFIHKVTQKHNFARNYFSRLPGMADILRQKVGSRELETRTGPSVAGHSVPQASQKV